MTTYLYEKDLRQMKLLILESRRHDAVVQEIATTLGIKRQQLRKILVERCDMILLENLPARCDAARETDDLISQSLGIPLITQAAELLTREEGARIRMGVNVQIEHGVPRETAILEAKTEILELIRV
ncbi:MAG: DUF1959 family protein [Methanocalculus sp.]|uniref:DUF1959 family protein n=1 Tax=Methanocalculus sp. TaxID=2004547 RepID=UPI00271A7D20|nr:DUF1959 family protein [Methanocalculus sp.]MDO9538941.1 DUF1959 family protein [Methanocalculus sp.]